MMHFLNNIPNELKRMLKLRNLTIAVIAPLLAALFFSFLYSAEIARDLPVGFYDADRSELSRTILRYVDASNYMKIDKELTSFEEIEKEIKSNNLEAVFVIPKNLETDVKSGKPATVTVFKNTANIVTGNMILKDAVTIIRTLSAGVFMKKLTAKGISFEQSLNLSNAISIEARPLFNPNYSYSVFLVPGLIFVTLQLAVMLASVIPSNSENNNGFFTRLIPQIIIQFVNLVIIMFLILPFFNIYLYNSLIPLLVLFGLMITASASISILISSISKNNLLNTEIVLLLNTPAFLFCGLTYPLNLMPYLHNWFAQIIPFTHFLEGFIKVFYMNSSISVAAKQINILSAYSIGTMVLTLLVLYYKKKRVEFSN